MTPFLQARHYRPADRSRVAWVVLHSAEIGESLEGAEVLMRRCAEKRLNAAGKEIVSSWHYAVDADSVTQSVLETHIAFHAPGANSLGIGIEMCGRARQTAEEWDDAFSRTMIARTAKLVSDICQRWGIPTEWVYEGNLVEGTPGVTTHAEVSKAFRKSTHTDPGPNFPSARFMSLVKTYGNGVA